jgi:ABC-type sugar transport system ATPase subunit
MTSSPLLQMRGIRKSFAGVPVLRGVDLTLHSGETLALLGGNGAGKSTLIKILNGDYTRDAGEILIDGVSTNFRSPADAEAAGIQVIYQELNYAPDLTVGENVMMGHLPARRGPLGRFSVNWSAVHQRSAELLLALEADVQTHSFMRDLSVGQQQIVEIAKALSREARILVMDEPTAALTPREVRLLFGVIERLRERGVGVVFISHRLDEVEEIAQRVMVLRDGCVAGEERISELCRADIIRMMIGRDLESTCLDRDEGHGETVLELRGLARRSAFEGVSLSVAAGEVVGLFGLLGAGHEEVLRAVFGAEAATAGEVVVNGRAERISCPRDAKRAGIGFVPQDRKTDGLIHAMPVRDNITIANWSAVAPGGVFRKAIENQHAQIWVERLGIVTRGGVSQEVRTLSGGNQQKVVLARWLEAGTKALLLAEPTRGVDVGARADIYGAIEDLRKRGLAILLVSSDMEEVLNICDRVLVFRQGRIAREFTRQEATQSALLSAAAGEDAA